MQAGFLGGKTFNLDKDEALRPHLVDWLTAKDNPYFARSFANRMWFYFFARGIVNPVDDFRELNPPSHPGLDETAGQRIRRLGLRREASDPLHLQLRGVSAHQPRDRAA